MTPDVAKNPAIQTGNYGHRAASHGETKKPFPNCGRPRVTRLSVERDFRGFARRLGDGQVLAGMIRATRSSRMKSDSAANLPGVTA